jgi:hypothetical protein
MQSERIARAITNDAGIARHGRYRYWLTRACADRPVCGPFRAVNFICLNPSTADASSDDPTVRRLRGFTKAWGYDGFWLTNLFAYRATDPTDLCTAEGDVVGPLNDAWLVAVATRADLVVAAWGAVDGLVRNNVRFAERRACYLLSLLHMPIHTLGVTKNAFPRHPLYLRGDTQPTSPAFTMPPPAASPRSASREASSPR